LENGGPTIWWKDLLESIDGIAYPFKLYFLLSEGGNLSTFN
jgi:hypothetical protein